MMISYSDLPCGGGKTRYAIDQLTRSPVRAIMAVDRLEIMSERRASLLEAAERHGRTPVIREIRSGDEEALGPVWRRIEEAAGDHDQDPHTIILVTHTGLLSADLSRYTGWELWVDEIPSILTTISRTANPCDLAWLRSQYRLETVAPGRSRPRFDGSWTPADLMTSTMAGWRDWHDLVLSGEAIVGAETWDDVEAAGSWAAWRCYDPSRHWSAFRAVTILGDSLQHHQTGRLLSRMEDVTLQRITMPPPPPSLHRNVTIQYFDHDHGGSSYRFQDREFRQHLTTVARWIAADASDDHIIALNIGPRFPLREIFEAEKVRGKMLSPLQAGSNAYRDMTQATMLYTAKPSGAEQAILCDLGLTASEIIAAREYYAVNQFLLRTAARDPQNPSDLIWRVWSRHTAEWLSDRTRAAYGYTVEPVHIDLGVTAAPKRTKTKMTEDERALSRQRALSKYNTKRKAARALARETK